MPKKSQKKSIPQEVKNQVAEIVQKYNETELKNSEISYLIRYRQDYVYLDRNDFGMLGKVCRLKYSGKMNNWEFAIDKYSDEVYSTIQNK